MNQSLGRVCKLAAEPPSRHITTSFERDGTLFPDMLNSVFLPLQYSLPGAVEFLVIGLIALLLIIIPTVWVYRDAKRRGMNAPLWAIIVAILLLFGLFPGLIGLAVYFWQRDEIA